MKKLMISVVLITMILLTGTGCKDVVSCFASSDYVLPEGSEAVIQVKYPEHIDSEKDFDAWFQRRENYPVDNDFMNSVDSFSYRTAAAILGSSGDENINYSPTSLYYALAVTAAGAEGETKQEILDLLGVKDEIYLAQQCKNLFIRSYSTGSMGSMTISNSIWVDDSLRIKESFAENAANNFFASAHYGDFSDPELADTMSTWVWKSTNYLLRPEFELSEDQIFSIINAIYFASEWTDEFNGDDNTTEPFYLADGGTDMVEYMNKVSQAVFYRGENYTQASLGLKKGIMYFILPDEKVSVNELIRDEAALTEAFEGGEGLYGKVTWQLPKFSFESDLDLTDAVQALGAGSMFSEKADFSGISNDQLVVTNIIQGTKISVDEKGVEAAAYTEIAYAGSAIPEDEAEMILNRPFIYGITDDLGNLVFIGICGDPNGE